MEEDTPMIKLKVVMAGDMGVGKSCLVGAYSALRTDRTISFDKILKEAHSKIGNPCLLFSKLTITLRLFFWC